MSTNQTPDPFAALRAKTKTTASTGNSPKRMVVAVTAVDTSKTPHQVVGVDAETKKEVRVSLRNSSVGANGYTPLQINELLTGRGNSRPLVLSDDLKSAPYVTFRGVFDDRELGEGNFSGEYMDILSRGKDDPYICHQTLASFSVFWPRDNNSNGSIHAHLLRPQQAVLANSAEHLEEMLTQCFRANSGSGRPFAYVRVHAGEARFAVKVEIKQALDADVPTAEETVKAFLDSDAGQALVNVINSGNLSTLKDSNGNESMAIEIIPGTRIPAGRSTRTDWFKGGVGENGSFLTRLMGNYSKPDEGSVSEVYTHSVLSLGQTEIEGQKSLFFRFIGHFQPHKEAFSPSEVTTPFFDGGAAYKSTPEDRQTLAAHFKAIATGTSNANNQQQAPQQQQNQQAPQQQQQQPPQQQQQQAPQRQQAQNAFDAQNHEAPNDGGFGFQV